MQHLGDDPARDGLDHLALFVGHAGEAASSASGLFGFADGMKAIDGRATAYVCVNYACSRPTQDSGEMLRLLDPDRVRF